LLRIAATGQDDRGQRGRGDDHGRDARGHPVPFPAVARLRRNERERRQRLDGLDLEQPHRLLEPLQPHRPAPAEANALDLLSKGDGRLGRKDLPRLRQAAQPRSRVQRCTSVAAFDRDGFTRVEADPDRQRKERTTFGLPTKRALQFDRRPDGPSGRAEDTQRLVAAELDQLAARRDHLLARELGKPRRKSSRLLVAVVLGEACVPADVGEQERADLSS